MPMGDELSLSVARITLYPVKALDGVDVAAVDAVRGGGLAGDRRYALMDADGCFVNGKRTAEMHRVRAGYNLDTGTLSLRVEGFGDLPDDFHLATDGDRVAEWFGDYLGLDLKLVSNAESGFPDDMHCSGPTVVSTATLETVATWFDGLGTDEIRRRFRANLELESGVAFAEECLFSADREPVPFTVGQAQFNGMQPCVRCIVPTRGALDGVSLAGFQPAFEAGRARTMPAFVDRGAFQTLYSLTVNTRVARTGRIALGDHLDRCPPSG